MTEKIFLENSYLRELSANIRSKEFKDGKYHIKLDRTLFYPHLSGGQPKDEGKINNIPVTHVYEEGDDIIHVLNEDINSVTVDMVIDWNVRFTHMQQHTGQHILSSVFQNLFNATTVGFHLGSEFTYIDIELPKLTNDTIAKVEDFANKIIFSNFNIKTHIITKDEIGKFPLRKYPKVDKNIRIIEIDGIEYSPCGGTHVSSTGEVGMIKIRKWEKYKGNVRIEFVCGYRALEDYRWKNNQINDISNILSVKDNESLDGVTRLFNENKSLSKDLRVLKEELLIYRSNDLLKDSILYNGIKIVCKVTENEDFKDLRYMTNKLLSDYRAIVVLGVKEENKCQVLLGRSKDIDLNLREIFKDVINIIDGKGGGSLDLVQGGGPNVEQLPTLINKALEIIKDKI